MQIMNKLPNMEPVVVRHEELKLIGIPCISLQDMSSKYRHAKEGLLSSTKHFPQVVNQRVITECRLYQARTASERTKK